MRFGRCLQSCYPLLLILPQVGFPHHSLSGNFLFEEQAVVELTGTLSQVDWRNPHVRLSVDVRSDNDGARLYRLESYPSNYFEYHGFSKDDFTLGARLVLEIYPARDGAATVGWVRVIRFPDGTVFAPVRGDEISSSAAD